MKSTIMFLLINFIFISSAPLYAENLTEIKARMQSRYISILELKNDGIIGENNRGLLEYRQSQKPKEQLVAAENRDRLTAYKKIAKDCNKSIEDVGKRRALQIRELAADGHWLQNSDGYWFQKNKSSKIPDSIYNEIREKCANKWPGDYRMQKYCVEEQTKAWKYLNE